MTDEPERWSVFVRQWFGAETVAFHRDHGRPERVPWSGGLVHQDVYDRPEADAPVVVMVHGIQGYGRMLLPVTAALWRRGCVMILPDVPGCGLSATHRDKGRRPILDQIAGVEAVVRAAAERWPDRPLVLSGVSLGSPTAFATALRVPQVRALALWNLFSPDDPDVLRGSGRFGAASGAFLKVMKPVARAAPGIPMAALVGMSLENLNDTPGFLRSMLHDPLVAKTSNLGVMQSLQEDLPPLLRYEDWHGPILVLQPGEDRMILPDATRRAFARLTNAAEPKRLVILDGVPHFPAEVAAYERAAALVAGFLEEAGLLRQLTRSP